MNVSLCIHGHFYQPPREDPWLGAILSEAGAAPMRNWNERILRESYAPLGWARILNSEGRIADILNAYEWISFNVGPTLTRWMREAAPETLARMRAGDAASVERLGHGNALAQIYHHVIMPLAAAEDKELEVRWAVDDFRAVFGRDPEGIWLSEAAVDYPTLEVLASLGLRFVILAPRQAKAVLVDGRERPVTEGGLNIGEPYLLPLPSGGSITAVFYHGALSQAIAFESLLSDGENFWRRIVGEADRLARANRAADRPPLLTLATDGETYGHHFKFGEMALAHVLAQGAVGRDGVCLTNIAAYLAAHPPVKRAVIHEPSSWSCVHGVERWRSDCGCTDGGHGDWNQRWRAPLRAALDRMRDAVNTRFAEAGNACFLEPRAALRAYGRVLADPATGPAFAEAWLLPAAHGTGDTGAAAVGRQDSAWKLLAAQEQALAAFASCAWFFDDIARIEPENGMTYALRAMDLIREAGGDDAVVVDGMERFLTALDPARSNQAGKGSGRDVFLQDVLPRRADAARLCLSAFLLLRAEGRWPEPGASAAWTWPSVSVEVLPDTPASVDDRECSGRAILRSTFETRGMECTWRFLPPSESYEISRDFLCLADSRITVRPLRGSDLSCSVRDLSRPMRDYLQAATAVGDERRQRPRKRAEARHLLSLIEPWPEEQHTIMHPELFASLAPYVVLECIVAENLTPERRGQAEQLVRQHLSEDAARFAAGLTADYLRDALSDFGAKEAFSDLVLAEVVRRARRLLPGMDLWAVQNKVWEAGPERMPAVAAALGF